MPEQQATTCTFCGREMPEGLVPERGINTGRPYCPESHINECNSAYGKRAGSITVRADTTWASS